MTIQNLSLLCAPFRAVAPRQELPVAAANDESWRARMLAAACARSAPLGDRTFAHDLAMARALAG